MSRSDIIVAVLFVAFVVGIYVLLRRAKQSPPVDLKQYEPDSESSSSRRRHGWGGFGLISNIVDSAQEQLRGRADELASRDGGTKD